MERKLELYKTDCESILAHLKYHERELKIKRRWLMGLSLSKSEQKKLSKYKSLPESLLRKDDIFYETVKTCVEEAFGACKAETDSYTIEDNKQLFDRTNMKRIILSRLDALTNKALFLVAILLTRGSINYEKTRKQMKKAIKESLPKFLADHNHDHSHIETFTQLCKLLNDPRNVQEDCLNCESHHAAAIKILDGLEDLSFETLLAMDRKLRGVPAGIPLLQRKRHGRNRDHLISKVRRTSEQMLSELGAGDELQEPLAKALSIAGLSLKLAPGHPNESVTDFNQFSPGIRTLQNEIAKAIWLLKTKVRIPELKTLQHLLDPDSNVSNGCLRTAMKKMLTEFLFECSELDTIPKSLLEALAIINRSSRSPPGRCFLKEQIEEEVECILSVSAQIKQIVWDLLPDMMFDEDFTEAYMEELEESDDGDDNDVGHSRRPYSIDLDQPEESCGEYIPEASRPPLSTHVGSCGLSQVQEERNLSGMLNVDISCSGVKSMDLETMRINKDVASSEIPQNGRLNDNSVRGNEPKESSNLQNPLGLQSSDSCFKGETFMPINQSSCNNIYLRIQDVCDETSMVAYNLVGCIMEELAKIEGLDLDYGDSSYLRGHCSIQENQEERCVSVNGNAAGSVIVHVVQELVPSLSKSKMEKLKQLMDVQ